MTSRIVAKIDKSFCAKIFFLFLIFMLVVVLVFTAVYTYSRGKALKESVLSQGETLVTVFANNARVAVFTEHPLLLKETLEGVAKHEGFLCAAIYDREGKLLSRLAADKEAVKAEKTLSTELMKQIARSSSPLSIDFPDRIDFLWVVSNKQRWASSEEIYFGSPPPGDYVIGYAKLSFDKRRYGKEILQLLRNSLITSAICLMVGSLLIYIFMRRLTSPLHRLINGVNLLGDGSYPHVAVETGDEIGRMAMAFNELVEKLQAREEDRRYAEEMILMLNADLERKVAERTSELEKANKELALFSYAASHDLRGPLARIQGFCELLKGEHMHNLDDQGKYFVERLLATSRQMDDTIRAMLSLSKLSKSEITKERISLTQIANDVATTLKETEPQRQNPFLIQPGVYAEGDAKMLRVVLENLMENSWKFSSKNPKGAIEFSATVTDGKDVFCVRDEGVGFDMSYADQIFSPFHRLHDASEFPGTGIGLATVRKIIERHGGDVWISSEEGKGTKVCFTLVS